MIRATTTMDGVFDEEELMEELDGDVEFLAESIETLKSDSPPLLAELREAIGNGDADSMRDAAHTLKGMLLNFCAPSSIERASQLEIKGRNAEFHNASEDLESLANEVESLTAALVFFCASLNET